MIRNWLRIQPATPQPISIREPMSPQAQMILYGLWYRGDASLLDQAYKQFADDPVLGTMFWAAAPETEKIRKIHSSLPGLMVDVLAGIVKADLDGPRFRDAASQSLWEAIAEEVDLPALTEQAVAGALALGDGAFKISADAELSEIPIVEFWSGDRVEYHTRHGRVTQVDFWSSYWEGSKEYRLREAYGVGFIDYTLFDGDKEVPLDRVPELSGLRPMRWDKKIILAEPFRVYKGLDPGRGRSIFQGKTGDFDALDEVISQWWDAVRSGRPMQYIPESMIPRDPKTGALREACPFGMRWVSTEANNKEGAVDKIETYQAEIPSDSYLQSYAAALDLCLQGIVSPATLGIDVGKMASADAQREKKDVTGATRNAITAALEKTLPKLVTSVMAAYCLAHGQAIPTGDPDITFGEYGAPSFDSRVETLSKAAASSLMSVDAYVRELWGSSKDEKWLDEEVERIKRERGLEAVEEPFVGGEGQ